MKMWVKSVFMLVTLLMIVSAHGAIPPSSPFQITWDEDAVKIANGEHFQMKVIIRAPEGHYLYADETELDFTSLDGLIISDIRYPKSVPYVDPYLGKKVNVYRGDIVITIAGHVPEHLGNGERDLVAKVNFRGCSPSICYRAEEHEAIFRINVTKPLTAEKPSTKEPQPSAMETTSVPDAKRSLLEVSDFSDILKRGLGLTVLIVFIAGLLTSLTPCVWPILPVVLLFVGVHPHKKFLENFLLSGALTLGLVLVYAVLGVVAVMAGKNLGFLFQQRIFLAIVVLFFLAMSLSMFGVFDIRLPSKWQQRLHSLGGKGYRGAFLAGMGTGLVASPCSGPVLAALLGHVALQRSYTLGFVLLVIYGTGMSLLIVILGACYGELAGKLRGGPWMVWIRRLLGIILLFPAAFYMGSLFHWSDDHMISKGNEIHIEWVTSEFDALKFAGQTNRSIMIEFGAEWCPPCIALEKRFFTKKDIVALSYHLVPFKVDATIETKEVRRLIEKYQVAGWPTVLFLDPHGKIYRDLRVNDSNAYAIERGMKEAIKRTGGPDNKQ